MMYKIKRTKADKLFSEYLRTRASGICEYCKRKKKRLEVSHFFGRKNKNVRFDIENVVPLCNHCHRYLGSNPYDHYEFILKRIGVERFKKLVVRAKIYQIKIDETLLCTLLTDKLERMENDK